ncbi:MAG: leucine-rich repeat domain-containing protein [Ruminiclostridium sp.]|nr:leucine-rich repeat domain-containing protein [Ruminiclostridium sp.]
MQCRNCQAKLPVGKIRCPECGFINPYNIMGYGNTKAVQTALKTMIEEQYGVIANGRQLNAVMFDYLPEYDMERKLLQKAVSAGILEALIGAEDKKAAFKEQRNRLMREAGFLRYDAEFVLTCFAYMMGFAYVSPMLEYDRLPVQEEPEKPVSAPVKAKPKAFGKFDAFKFKLSSKVFVKEGYTEIAAYCFDSFGLMKEVSLPSTLSAVGEYAFSDCKSLESITIPDAVRKMEKGVFSACLGLKDVRLPEGVLSIGDNCFFCCTSLKTLRVPDNVSSIGENAFSGCAELERLIIPKSVKFIDKNAFAYCGKLTVICTENSFVHKYCMQNEIKYRTYAAGMKLPERDEAEDEPDE